MTVNFESTMTEADFNRPLLDNMDTSGKLPLRSV